LKCLDEGIVKQNAGTAVRCEEFDGKQERHTVSVCALRANEKEAERQRETERGRERQRETERQRDRHRDTETQREKTPFQGHMPYLTLYMCLTLRLVSCPPLLISTEAAKVAKAKEAEDAKKAAENGDKKTVEKTNAAASPFASPFVGATIAAIAAALLVASNV
jgi:hypothetical protein